jgi:hypothetical protein
MGEALRRHPAARGGWRRAAALGIALFTAAPAADAQYAGERTERGRFTVIAEAADRTLARSLLDHAAATDTFPGLPRPQDRILVVIASDRRRFREYAGAVTPEWGSAFAFPAERRIVMQGSSAASDAGDPRVALRHELAHLALHEFMRDLPPRWFDEGYASYAAGEWGRDEVLATNVALALRRMPPLDSLDAGFRGGATRASATYALSYRAVAELAQLDRERGLTLFFRYWTETGSTDRAIRDAFGMTMGDFEKHWRKKTTQRYGALSLFANLALGAVVVAFFTTPLYLVRRRRDKRRLAAMRAREEAQERLERESAIEALLRDLGPSGMPPGAPPGLPPNVPGDSA